MPKSHTLLELSESIERVITRTFHATYWVSAEISKLNFYPKSGHCYPELVEKRNSKIVAEIRSTIWRNTYIALTQKFVNETGEHLREGMKILFAVKVNYSPTHGISLNIQDIDPSYTLGEIAREKKQAIALLKKEGLFDANKSLPFPFFPNKLAIISVQTSKGYQDFLETMNAKANTYNYQFELFPAILQGDVAVGSITEQLQVIEKRKAEFDVVLIIRGGGGDVGLNCYNHITMAKMVASFPIPVITGIGHSTNETVVEMVAHINRITPTAVADTFVEFYRTLENNLILLNQSILLTQDKRINPEKQKLKNIIHHLKASASSPMHIERMRLQKKGSIIQQGTERNISNYRNTLEHKIIGKLKTATNQRFKKAETHIDLIAAKIKILDPKNLLQRGYSMTTVNGKIINQTHQIQEGDTMVSYLADGELESKVIKIKHHE